MARLLFLCCLAATAAADKTDAEVLARLTAARDSAARIDPRFAGAEVGHTLTPEHDIYYVRGFSDGKVFHFRARLDEYEGASSKCLLELPPDIPPSGKIARIFRRALVAAADGKCRW